MLYISIPTIFCQLYINRYKNEMNKIKSIMFNYTYLNRNSPCFSIQTESKSILELSLFLYRSHEWVTLLRDRRFLPSSYPDGKRPSCPKRWMGQPFKIPETSHQDRPTFSARSPDQNRHKYPKLMPQRQYYTLGLAKQGSYFLIPGSVWFQLFFL